jgi:RNA polymerase sigma-70 factor (ECF subfamily)
MEQNLDTNGPLDSRYTAFLAAISQLRQRLHRYCSRMTGSVLDGEDLVQDALFEAYTKLDQFDETRSLAPWIFRIAHNRCIDFLRRQGVRTVAVGNIEIPESESAFLPPSFSISPAVEHLIYLLPPMQRACVLLKDVFDYSLEEIAEMVHSTVGGVKAALKRGRTKLAEAQAQETPKLTRKPDPQLMHVLRLYVDRFNRRDWDGLRELISADAQLRVVDAFAGRFADSPYFSNYARWLTPWKLAIGDVEGETVVIVLRRGVDTWIPHSFVRLRVSNGQIQRIVDYSHCSWIAPLARDAVRLYES